MADLIDRDEVLNILVKHQVAAINDLWNLKRPQKTEWNCTASFIADMLDRYKDMTDEEKQRVIKRIIGE